jgi:dTDP-4-amino-4,6-dideoxygalactose transaminase
MMNEHVPLLDLITSHRELEDELLGVVRDAVRSAQFIGGPEVECFEREFAAYCGTTHCVGVSSGTDALRFALTASGIGKGHAVVTVAHTFIATVEAISQAGAETEFVDIDEGTYTMSPGALADYLKSCRRDPSTGRPIGRSTEKPIEAIVPVHLYGQVAEMDPILELARQYGLQVIEDACQAHGAEYLSSTSADDGRTANWHRAGGLGRAAAFSFYPGKNLGACGEAGAVTTNDEEVARRVRMIRDHGQTKKYHHDLEGYNGRLDAIQAGFLRIKLRRLDAWNAQRRAAARRYDELFTAASLPMVMPCEPHWSRAVYHLYVLRVSDRETLAQHLKANGVHTGLHYPVPVHLQPCYREWGYKAGSLPVTERAASEVLSLPMFPGLTPEQQRRVADEVIAFMAGVGAQR